MHTATSEIRLVMTAKARYTDARLGVGAVCWQTLPDETAWIHGLTMVFSLQNRILIKVDPTREKVAVRATDGTTHEFQASKETLQDFKPGDRITAKWRKASPAECCPPHLAPPYWRGN